MSVSVPAPDASFASLRSFSSMCRVFFIQMIMPYLYGRNNQHGFNGVSRALHNRYLEGAFNTQFRLPQLRRRLEDHRLSFEHCVEEPPSKIRR